MVSAGLSSQTAQSLSASDGSGWGTLLTHVLRVWHDLAVAFLFLFSCSPLPITSLFIQISSDICALSEMFWMALATRVQLVLVYRWIHYCFFHSLAFFKYHCKFKLHFNGLHSLHVTWILRVSKCRPLGPVGGGGGDVNGPVHPPWLRACADLLVACLVVFSFQYLLEK